jgi:hypothetical protein
MDSVIHTRLSFVLPLLLGGCHALVGSRGNVEPPRPAGPRITAESTIAQAMPPPKDPVVPASNTAPALTLPEIPTLPGNLTPVAQPKLDPPPIEAKGTAKLRELHQKAAQTYAKMDTYIMRLRRREVVNGTPRGEELMLCKVRREPFSVYFKWLEGHGKGREVTYVKDKYEGKIHSLTAAGDVPLFTGAVFSVAPDSALVRSKSRYPITEAGIGVMLDRFDRLVTAAEKGQTKDGNLEYQGTKKRAEFVELLDVAVQSLPPKVDPNLPGGGKRFWHFEPTSGLPVLIIAYDEKWQEVEYYCHDRFEYPAHLDDDDFDPAKLFKQGK